MGKYVVVDYEKGIFATFNTEEAAEAYYDLLDELEDDT